MDIDNPVLSDTPPAALPLPEFSAGFPLPFRVLFLVGLALLLWAVNLHVLHLLGLDVSWVLDVRDGDDGDRGLVDVSADRIRLDRLPGLLDDDEHDHREPDTPTRPSPSPGLPPANVSRPSTARLYGPVYKLWAAYTLWCLAGYAAFRAVAGDDTAAMEANRAIVALVCAGPIVAALAPWRGVGNRERRALRRALWRCINPQSHDPIYFCDVILADIATSFAKVLGDLYIGAHQIIFGGISHGRVAQHGIGKWITLAMVCLPYVVRFRQCMIEFYHSGWKSMRPLANAFKYSSAFPVIFLSAAQKIVVVEVAAAKGMSVDELSQTGDRWFGEHRLFRMWLLAVVVNSMFSFYWDVQKDWGLSLLELDTWVPARRAAGDSPTPSRQGSPVGARRGVLARLAAFGRQPYRSSPLPTTMHLDSPTSPPKPAYFGLRSILLLPDPIVYYLFTIIDLILRGTWSLELSSHLHTMHDLESGVFLMEALELVRRWMWVFIRVEWEAVRMGEMQRFRGPAGHVERTAVLWDKETDT